MFYYTDHNCMAATLQAKCPVSQDSVCKITAGHKQKTGIVSHQCVSSFVNSTFAHISHTQHTAGVLKAQ